MIGTIILIMIGCFVGAIVIGSLVVLITENDTAKVIACIVAILAVIWVFAYHPEYIPKFESSNYNSDPYEDAYGRDYLFN